MESEALVHVVFHEGKETLHQGLHKAMRANIGLDSEDEADIERTNKAIVESKRQKEIEAFKPEKFYEIEGKWQASPWVSTVTQIQYDEQSDLFGLFSRLRWIVKPGNEVYFVYTHNWQNLSSSILEDPELRTLSRGA